MAKGNLFLGTAARSVGDVVMYRREGSQVSRVRVRKIANPRTNAQSLQRAAFAPVAKFYAPLATVLERSFEGMNKSKSYSKFLAENVKLARQNGWLLPKGTAFFPLPYKLSAGTLQGLTYTTNNGLDITVNGLSGDANTIGDLSTAFIANGYKDGDIITIIVVSSKEIAGGAKSYVPSVAQFAIDSTSTDSISTIFPQSFDTEIDANKWLLHAVGSDAIVAGAVIVARFENDKWRRSTQELSVDNSIMTEISTAAYKAAAIASYGNTTGAADPMVYLDGEDLQD